MTKEKDINIVEEILLACKNAGFPESSAKKVEQLICSQFGGRRFYVAKKKQLSDDERVEVLRQGIRSKFCQDVVKEYGITRASLYRMIKSKQ